MTAALVAIFTLILGVVCGLLFGRATNAPFKEAQELKDSLAEVQSEFDAYKTEVTQHFTKTAELVNSMTDNYRNVHTHLASGAQALCSGALQLESMNGKEALEAKAEAVKEPAPAEEPVTAEKSAEAAANDDVVATEARAANGEKDNTAVEASSGSDTTEVEQIKVGPDTVTTTEETASVETKPTNETPEELVAEATTEKNKSENRLH